MRLAFMGTPDFAVPSLAEIVSAGHDVVAVYSQPPKPRGRGMELKPSPVHAFAEGLGLDVRTPKSMKAPEEIEAFPHKNVIVRALGMKDSVQDDVSRLEPLPNDLYLLCSDGLSGMVKDADMEALCRDWRNDPARTDNVDGLCHELIAAACG